MADGREEAVEVFYRRYFDRLYAEARRSTRRDEAFCLDVVQEAVLRVIRSVRRVESAGQFHAWLNLVVRTTALDLLRSEKRRGVREAVTVPAESHDESDQGDRGEQIAWLRREIGLMDPELVRLIELRFEERWTLARIGARLGLSVGTIDGRLRRALQHLRDRAREDFP